MSSPTPVHGGQSEDTVAECSAYKATRLTDIVCKRLVRLHKDRLQTIHPDNSNEKTWYLDRSCKLEPEYLEEIVPEKRTVRPPGTWTVTAKLTTVTGSGLPINLFCVTIHWPTSWLATRGYTSFTLGFETWEEAAQWHSHIQKQISNLRLRLSTATSTNHSSNPPCGDKSIQCSGRGAVNRKVSQEKGFITAALEHWLGSKEYRPSIQEEADDYTQGPLPARSSSVPAAASGADDAQQYGQEFSQVPMGGAADASSDSSFSQGGSEWSEVQEQDEQRWVPYRHTNGVAIYHHKETQQQQGQQDTKEQGSEYMASSIVRGSPDECLSVLMDLTSNTTILGPASKIELLEAGNERQVLRMTVEATGMARQMCTPREVIVERVFQREECGVDVILFSSCESSLTSPSFKRRNSASSSGALPSISQVKTGAAAAAAVLAVAVAVMGGNYGAAAAMLFITLTALLLLLSMLYSKRLASCQTDLNSSSSSSAGVCTSSWLGLASSGADALLGLWYQPVRASVQGGYTISPREDCHGGNSPECLVTCILRVDLAGWLSEDSWFRPIADALGWVDAYIERMLMAVILVKDEVEQRRFMVQPFTMLTSMSGPLGHSPHCSAAGSEAAGGEANQSADQHRRAKRDKSQRQFGAAGRASGRWQEAAGPPAGSSMQYGQQQWPQETGQGYSVLQQQQAGSSGLIRRVWGGSGLQEKQQQQSGKHQQRGRFGRMASRIYALRPRLLRGNDRSKASAAQSSAAAQQHNALVHSNLSGGSLPFARQVADTGFDGDVAASTSAAAAASTAAEGSNAAAVAANDSALGLLDPKLLLSSVGLPADTVVVDPSYYLGGPQGPAARDATLDTKFWSELHTLDTPAPFKLRGPAYLLDRTKVDGGVPQFVLGSVDLVETPGPVQHISRFLPAVRLNQAAYTFVINLIIPGTPMLSLVAVFINEHHPDILEPSQAVGNTGADAAYQQAQNMQFTPWPSFEAARTSSSDANIAATSWGQQGSNDMTHKAAARSSISNDGPYAATSGSRHSHEAAGNTCDVSRDFYSSEGVQENTEVHYTRPTDTADWQPFDYALHRFLHGGDATRTAMFKLIPHIAEGSWVIKQSVGTVPVILGTKLKTVFYQTDRYFEACVDVTSSSAAAYITGMVRGATKSLVIDLGFVLEGQQPEELPEALLGAFRLNHLDCTTAKKLDISQELPLLPRPLQHHQLVALQQQVQQQLAAGSSALVQALQSSATAAEQQQGQQWHPVAGDGATQQAEEQSIQQAQPAAQHVQHLAQQFQRRSRNSLKAADGSRTMTGHARSRSAASVEELFDLTDNYQVGQSLVKKDAIRQTASGVTPMSAFEQHMQQEKAVWLQQGHQASHAVESGDYAAAADGHAALPGIRTGAGTADQPGVGAANSSSSSNVVLTPSKQLFGGLLGFGSGHARGAAASSAVSESSPAVVPSAGSFGGGEAAAPAVNTTPRAVGPVSAFSHGPTPTSTPVHTGHNTPNAAAAAVAGVAGLFPVLTNAHSTGSMGGRSCGVATPTQAAVSSSVALRAHYRSSSNSDSRAPGGPWPASPPTGSGDWSTKISASAYISRAHAAALAASAQRRSVRGQQQLQQQGVGSPVSSSSLVDAGAFMSGARDSASSSSWLGRQVRSSSASGAASLADAGGRQRPQQLLQQGASPGGVVTFQQQQQQLLQRPSYDGGGGSAANGTVGHQHKISASEQLRLTQSMLRTSSASGGQPAGAANNTSSIVNSSSNAIFTDAAHQSSGQVSLETGAVKPVTGRHMSLEEPGSRASRQIDAAAAGRGPVGSGSLQQQPLMHVKRKFIHRRFRSMGAVQ